MCVSAETSLALAGLLVPVGIHCMRNAILRDRSWLPLGAVPLLFGIQQACEGLVWIGLDRQDSALAHAAARAYLFLAVAFWPFWIPTCALFLESRRKWRLTLGIGALLGLAGGLAFYLPILLRAEALVVTTTGHSIRYDLSSSGALDTIPQLAWHLAYLAIVSWPLFLVSRGRKGVVALGVALVLSAVVSHVWFWYAFTSVWCFFAAIVSLVLGYVFHHLPKR